MKSTLTKYRNQHIDFDGTGSYRWSKTRDKWYRLPSAIEKAYIKANDQRRFGLVKVFDSESVL